MNRSDIRGLVSCDALADAEYPGRLSIEAFDITPGLECIACASPAHLVGVWKP